MVRKWAMLAVITLAVVSGPLFAEKANLSPDELRKTATHVITGQVAAIYAKTERAGGWEMSRFVAEVRVNDAEKGEGLRKGDLVYIRYWHRGWVGQGNPPPDTSGHRGLPTEGASIRVYLSRNAYDGFTFENKDGGFNVIGANGFEILKPGSATKGARP